MAQSHLKQSGEYSSEESAELEVLVKSLHALTTELTRFSQENFQTMLAKAGFKLNSVTEQFEGQALLFEAIK